MYKSIEHILINVGYDDLLKPNLSNYTFEPQWILDTKDNTTKYLKWSHIDKYLGNQLHTFNTNTIEHFYNNGSNFIYPITLYSNELFYNHSTIELSDVLIQCVKNKKAKIVFFYITEGDLVNVSWIEQLSVKYNLDKEDVIIITANLLDIVSEYVTIIPYNFFMDDLEFIEIVKTNKNSVKKYENVYTQYIENNRKNKKTKHFLCFNGIPRLNRLLMFGILQTNNKLKNTTISSLRNTNTNNPQFFYNEVSTNTHRLDLIEFYKTYDATQNNSYDTTNWENIYSWGGFVNDTAHNTTFINIVTETMWNKESIFFTEKIYKPIYMCQPFILFGNPNSLKKLKEYGFKTFDKWWDESYDDELDLELRLKKIEIILEEIASWSFDKCFNITNEMEEVLIHNYKILMRNDELYKIYSLLQTDTKPTKKSII
jgi:hypothetical protein